MLSSSLALTALTSLTASINLGKEAFSDLTEILGTTKTKAAKYAGAQPSFRMKKQGQTYPFSNTRQDERQRRQFSRATAKAASKAVVTTLEADGSTTRTWTDAEGCHRLWTKIPDPGPVFHTPFAAVPIATKEQP